MSHPLCRVIIFVEDMELMANFYSYLLLGEDSPQFEINEHWTEIANPSVSIALHGGGKNDAAAKAQDIKLCFYASNDQAIDDHLIERGASFLSERSPAENILVKDFRDPEGNEFSIEIY